MTASTPKSGPSFPRSSCSRHPELFRRGPPPRVLQASIAATLISAKSPTHPSRSAPLRFPSSRRRDYSASAPHTPTVAALDNTLSTERPPRLPSAPTAHAKSTDRPAQGSHQSRTTTNVPSLRPHPLRYPETYRRRFLRRDPSWRAIHDPPVSASRGHR